MWVENKLKLELEQKIIKATDKEDQANNIIWSTMVTNAGLGIVPIGINLWTFVATNSLMVVFLGSTYGYHLSKEDSAKLIKQIFGAVGWTWMASMLGIKFFAEVLKGIGIITMGGATAAGMLLDATLAGAVTYALGFTVKDYFAKGKNMSPSELEKEFKVRFQEGKEQVVKQRQI